MEQILNKYYTNNARKLHEMVDKLLIKFGGISDKDRDDFYSLANEVFVDTMRRYDQEQSFDSFLYSCLSNKIKSEMTRRNRYKRKADRMSVSIDTPVGDDESVTLGDMIASDINIEKEVLEKETDESRNIEQYLSSLSKIQRKIIELKMRNVEVNRIKEKLGITDKQYLSHMKQAIQYEYIRLLHI